MYISSRGLGEQTQEAAPNPSFLRAEARSDPAYAKSTPKRLAGSVYSECGHNAVF